MRLKRGLRRITTSSRAGRCGRDVAGLSFEVHGLPAPDGNGYRAVYQGVRSCGLHWICPTCGPRIRHEWALDIAELVARHGDAGGALLFVTNTLRHAYIDPLTLLLDGLSDAYRSTNRGEPYKRWVERLGMIGRMRSTEVTIGVKGFHPHTHSLVLLTAVPDPADLAEFSDWYSARWVAMVKRRGLSEPSHERGSDVQLVTRAEDAAHYLAKLQEGTALGLELARGDATKLGGDNLLPMEVLDQAVTYRDPDAVAIWRQYEKATKGRRAISFTPGLRKRYELPPGRRDEDIVASYDGISDETRIYRGTCAEYSAVVSKGLEVVLLERAERDGLTGVLEVVANAYGHVPMSDRSDRG